MLTRIFNSFPAIIVMVLVGFYLAILAIIWLPVHFNNQACKAMQWGGKAWDKQAAWVCEGRLGDGR